MNEREVYPTKDLMIIKDNGKCFFGNLTGMQRRSDGVDFAIEITKGIHRPGELVHPLRHYDINIDNQTIYSAS